MHVKVHYQGLDSSPWMDDFITKRVEKLSRYLNAASGLQVQIKFANRTYSTTLAIHNHHDYSYSAEGENLYESFSSAVDKATRGLSENKRKIKDRIHRKFASTRLAA